MELTPYQKRALRLADRPMLIVDDSNINNLRLAIIDGDAENTASCGEEDSRIANGGAILDVIGRPRNAKRLCAEAAERLGIENGHEWAY